MTTRRLALVIAIALWCGSVTAQSDALSDYARKARLKKQHVRMVPLEMGTLAPDITASQWLNTKPLDLVQLRGKVVLVDFWAIWCAPCVASLPEVARLSKANADLFVVTVHYTASADRVRQYLRQHDIRFPVAIDDGETWKRFSVRHLPTYVLIDRDGRVQWAGQKPPVQADVDRLMPRR